MPPQVISSLVLKLMNQQPVLPIVIRAEPARLNEVLNAISARNLDMTTRSLEATFARPPLPPPPPLFPMFSLLPTPPFPSPPPLPFARQVIPSFEMFNLVSSPSDIEEIASIDGVQRIFVDLPVRAIGPTTAPYPQELMKGWVTTQQINKELEIDAARKKGLNGEGVTVAIIDTGVNNTHPMFQGKVMSLAAPPHPPQVDENGHGSWCVSAVGGNAYTSPQGIYCEGVAPKARLIAIKVLGFGIGTGTTSGVLKGMEMAVQQGADIASMSLGSDGIPEADSPLCQIVNETKDKIIWVIAAGNSGPGVKTIGTPGNAKGAITVGSLSYFDRTPAYFSSRGPTLDGIVKPTIMCFGGGRKKSDMKPKELCFMATSLGSVLDGIEDKVKDGWEAMQGTSMATPRLAGMMALWKQARPELTTDEVLRIFREVGGSMSNEAGYGLAKFTWLLEE